MERWSNVHYKIKNKRILSVNACQKISRFQTDLIHWKQRRVKLTNKESYNNCFNTRLTCTSHSLFKYACSYLCWSIDNDNTWNTVQFIPWVCADGSVFTVLTSASSNNVCRILINNIKRACLSPACYSAVFDNFSPPPLITFNKMR